MKRYTHYYNGKRTSRGKRGLSKILKGTNQGNLKKAFDEVEQLKTKK